VVADDVDRGTRNRDVSGGEVADSLQRGPQFRRIEVVGSQRGPSLGFLAWQRVGPLRTAVTVVRTSSASRVTAWGASFLSYSVIVSPNAAVSRSA